MTPKQTRNEEFEKSLASVHMNHAGVSPIPKRTQAAIGWAATQLSSSVHSFFNNSFWPVMDEARRRFALLLGADPTNVAFTKNTGHGSSIIADGLRVERGDNVVLVEGDYPAVNYPWLAQAERGVEVRVVKPDGNGSFTIDQVAELCDSRTKAVALSWVQFRSGFRIDPNAFAQLAHSFGAILVLDVIQGLGVHPISLVESQVDVAITGVHKWLMSPSGVGGLYIAPSIIDRIGLVNMGAASTVDVMSFNSDVFEPKPNALRYEEGSPNALGICALSASLSLIEDIGLSQIELQVFGLTRMLSEGLSSMGYNVNADRRREHWSGLLYVQHAQKSADCLLERLAERGVNAAIRGGRLRLSPHFYNNEDDIDRVLHALR